MKFKDDDLISVRNRNNGSTGYSLDGGIHRHFNPNEVKKLPFKELTELQYSTGGRYIIENLLVVEDEEALKQLNMQVEPEYFYTEDIIKDILFNKGYAELADFLDFAPKGAIEILKTVAIKEEVPDVKKREMISEATGLNINSAIMVNHVMDADDEPSKDESKKERRVPLEDKAPAEKERRTEAPNYKVVNQGK